MVSSSLIFLILPSVANQIFVKQCSRMASYPSFCCFVVFVGMRKIEFVI